MDALENSALRMIRLASSAANARCELKTGDEKIDRTAKVETTTAQALCQGSPGR